MLGIVILLTLKITWPPVTTTLLRANAVGGSGGFCLLGAAVEYEVWYRIPEVCDEAVYRLSVVWHPLCENYVIQEAIASACGRDYYDSHNGGECSWPLEVSVHTSEDGPAIFSAVVERELLAKYSGTVIHST